jgi:quercetin dioxygenase-like cupin family protein
MALQCRPVAVWHEGERAQLGGSRCTEAFEPSARTAWHTHPLGQTLIVTTGCGLVQSWGGPIEKIRLGTVAFGFLSGLHQEE